MAACKLSYVAIQVRLQSTFTGPIARGLSLVAIVVGGVMFAFGEGGSKRALTGIIFGVGMAIGAENKTVERAERVLRAWAAADSGGYCQVKQNLPVLRKDSAGSETENQ